MASLRIVLAEDNLLVREGLVSLLGTCDEIELVATCESLPELLAAAEQHRPDVVLTDIRMPPDHSDEGVRAAEILRESQPDLGVVVISQFAEPEYVIAVLGEGSRGRGYVVKDRVDDLGHLLGAIRAVAAELANAEGDAAVQRAFVRSQVWQLLTSEQQVTALELEIEMKERMEQRRARSGERGDRRERRRQ